MYIKVIICHNYRPAIDVWSLGPSCASKAIDAYCQNFSPSVGIRFGRTSTYTTWNFYASQKVQANNFNIFFCLLHCGHAHHIIVIKIINIIAFCGQMINNAFDGEQITHLRSWNPTAVALEQRRKSTDRRIHSSPLAGPHKII